MQMYIRCETQYHTSANLDSFAETVQGDYSPMYTGVPHFDLKILEADMMLLNPKSVICNSGGVT